MGIFLFSLAILTGFIAGFACAITVAQWAVDDQTATIFKDASTASAKIDHALR